MVWHRYYLEFAVLTEEPKLVPYDEAQTEWSKSPQFKRAYDRAKRDSYFSSILLVILISLAAILVLMIGVQVWSMV